MTALPIESKPINTTEFRVSDDLIHFNSFGFMFFLSNYYAEQRKRENFNREESDLELLQLSESQLLPSQSIQNRANTKKSVEEMALDEMDKTCQEIAYELHLKVSRIPLSSY